MSMLTIRNLEPAVKERLRLRAARRAQCAVDGGGGAGHPAAGADGGGAGGGAQPVWTGEGAVCAAGRGGAGGAGAGGDAGAAAFRVMFLLDTTVLSAMTSGATETAAWLAGQRSVYRFTAMVVIARVLRTMKRWGCEVRSAGSLRLVSRTSLRKGGRFMWV